MLYLIGVAHRAQAKSPHTNETDEQRLFVQTMRATIKRVRPIFLAEEDSEEALMERQEVSICKGVAEEVGIEHRFCDPTKAERNYLGYKDQTTCRRDSFLGGIQGLSAKQINVRGDAIFISCHFPKRERFWLDKLNGCRNHAAIFICGDGHIESDSFRRLLESKKIPYEVVARGIGVTEEDRWVNDALQYLQGHPDLKNESSDSDQTLRLT